MTQNFKLILPRFNSILVLFGFGSHIPSYLTELSFLLQRDSNINFIYRGIYQERFLKRLSGYTVYRHQTYTYSNP